MVDDDHQECFKQDDRSDWKSGAQKLPHLLELGCKNLLALDGYMFIVFALKKSSQRR